MMNLRSKSRVPQGLNPTFLAGLAATAESRALPTNICEIDSSLL
jgi:hypothetical protein